MTTYTVVSGDTLDRVSTIAYGTPIHSQLILSANPQASGGITPGMVLTIPILPGLESPPVRLPSSRENEVSVSLGGKPFRFWSMMSLTRALDSFDRFTLSAPFESQHKAFQEAFVPMSFQSAQLIVGGRELHNGVMVALTTTAGITGKVITMEGYARAGVLNDCPMPSTDFPIEYILYTLEDIAREQSKVFGLDPVFRAPPGAAFDFVKMNASTKVLAFWRGLAQKKKLVISNNEVGQPVFQQEADTKPIQLLEFGSSPVLSITPQLNPQAYYSHVTAVTSAFSGIAGAQHTVENPFLRGVTRPLTFQAGDLLPGDEIEAAESKMGRMFANSIAFKVDVAGWRDVNGDLWEPNKRIQLLAPPAFIYKITDVTIRSVTLARDADKDRAELLCTLPGGFAGRVPETLPWLLD